MASAELDAASPDEDQVVEAWEVGQLVRLGFSLAMAERLATRGVGWHDAKRLTDLGCPTELAARILE